VDGGAHSGSSLMSFGSRRGCAFIWWRKLLELSYALIRTRMIEPSGRCSSMQSQGLKPSTSSP
jgi:hypothetical protein